MMRLLSAIFAGLVLTVQPSSAQSAAVQREIDKASRETLPRAGKAIEEATDARVTLEVDVASFAEDAKAWSNLNIIASRVVAALSEVGKDQVGKDAIARGVRKVAIVRLADSATGDSAELKEGTLIVKTTATDDAMALLQNVITRTLEKAL